MRARYDVLFVANVRAHAPSKSQKLPPPVPKRQNAGWRGLSIDIDMVAGTYAAPAQTKSISTAAPEPAPDARLDGRIVRKIWLKSGLDAQRLRDIWCVIISIHIIEKDAEKKNPPICNFPSCRCRYIGMSVIRMGRVCWTATRLRVGWRGSMRSCGERRCLVGLMALGAGAPRVLRVHCGRFLLVRSSAEFSMHDALMRER
jgi:hypothetical protein